MAYADRAGLDRMMGNALVVVIRKMDEVYRKWHDAETKKRGTSPG